MAGMMKSDQRDADMGIEMNKTKDTIRLHVPRFRRYAHRSVGGVKKSNF
jgi:hypothetical protein